MRNQIPFQVWLNCLAVSLVFMLASFQLEGQSLELLDVERKFQEQIVLNHVIIKLKPRKYRPIKYDRTKSNGTSKAYVEQQLNISLEQYGIVRVENSMSYLSSVDSNAALLYTIYYKGVVSKKYLMQDLLKSSIVEFVSFDETKYNVFQTYTPNDYSVLDQWSLDKINAPESWHRISCVHPRPSNATVAVLDNGTNIDHEDLTNVIWTNPLDNTVNGNNEDNNGYVDDVHGWDFAENNNNVKPVNVTPPCFKVSHGTQVAGLVGAQSHNSAGIASNNIDFATGSYPITILPLKLTYNSNCESIPNTQVILDALDYAAEKNANVINMSFGIFQNQFLPGDFSALQYGIDLVAGQGIVLVASVGNKNQDMDALGFAVYPAAFSNVIGVANTDINDKQSLQSATVGSNYGSQVDISAPGTLVKSTHSTNNTAYGLGTGTSFSAPLVSGFCALLKAYDPSLTRLQITDLILDNTDNIDLQNPGLSGKLGSGRLNQEKTINTFLSQKFDLLPDVTSVFCEYGEKIDLDATIQGGSYNWTLPNGGSSTNPALANLNTPGDYQVSVSLGSEGCNVSDATELICDGCISDLNSKTFIKNYHPKSTFEDELITTKASIIDSDGGLVLLYDSRNMPGKLDVKKMGYLGLVKFSDEGKVVWNRKLNMGLVNGLGVYFRAINVRKSGVNADEYIVLSEFYDIHQKRGTLVFCYNSTSQQIKWKVQNDKFPRDIISSNSGTSSIILSSTVLDSDFVMPANLMEVNDVTGVTTNMVTFRTFGNYTDVYPAKMVKFNGNYLVFQIGNGSPKIFITEISASTNAIVKHKQLNLSGSQNTDLDKIVVNSDNSIGIVSHSHFDNGLGTSDYMVLDYLTGAVLSENIYPIDDIYVSSRHVIKDVHPWIEPNTNKKGYTVYMHTSYGASIPSYLQGIVYPHIMYPVIFNIYENGDLATSTQAKRLSTFERTFLSSYKDPKLGNILNSNNDGYYFWQKNTGSPEFQINITKTTTDLDIIHRLEDAFTCPPQNIELKKVTQSNASVAVTLATKTAIDNSNSVDISLLDYPSSYYNNCGCIDKVAPTDDPCAGFVISPNFTINCTKDNLEIVFESDYMYAVGKLNNVTGGIVTEAFNQIGNNKKKLKIPHEKLVGISQLCFDFYGTNGCSKQLCIPIPDQEVKQCEIVKTITCGTSVNLDAILLGESCTACGEIDPNGFDWVSTDDEGNPIIISANQTIYKSKSFTKRIINPVTCSKCEITINIEMSTSYTVLDIYKNNTENPNCCEYYTYNDLLELFNQYCQTPGVPTHFSISNLTDPLSGGGYVYPDLLIAVVFCPGNEYEILPAGISDNCCRIKVRLHCTTEQDYIEVSTEGIVTPISIFDQTSNHKTIEKETSTLQLVPNPTSSFFRIQSSNTKRITYDQVEILDLTGKLLKKLEHIDSNHEYDLSKYSKGEYIIRIRQGTNSHQLKLILLE